MFPKTMADIDSCLVAECKSDLGDNEFWEQLLTGPIQQLKEALGRFSGDSHSATDRLRIYLKLFYRMKRDSATMSAILFNNQEDILNDVFALADALLVKHIMDVLYYGTVSDSQGMIDSKRLMIALNPANKQKLADMINRDNYLREFFAELIRSYYKHYVHRAAYELYSSIYF